jgi:myo-inositol-hexaphosphate 3-phosphohydrolase
MLRPTEILFGFAFAALATAAIAPTFAFAEVAVVTPTLETANLGEENGDADADDPAFWIDPADAAKSLVITAVKNGGIRVYDLQGAEVQVIDRVTTDAGKGRINNIDVIYGLALSGYPAGLPDRVRCRRTADRNHRPVRGPCLSHPARRGGRCRSGQSAG